MIQIQRALALLLVSVFVFLALPMPAAAEEASLVNPNLLAGLQTPTKTTIADPPAQKPSDRRWTKGGKIMTIIGLGIAGAGAVMTTQKNTDLGNGTEVNWRTTGYIWMGGGAALTLIGLTRRN